MYLPNKEFLSDHRCKTTNMGTNFETLVPVT